MARPVTVGRTSVAPCGKTIWGISMTTDTPLISNLYANLEQAAVGYPGD